MTPKQEAYQQRRKSEAAARRRGHSNVMRFLADCEVPHPIKQQSKFPYLYERSMDS